MSASVRIMTAVTVIMASTCSLFGQAQAQSADDPPADVARIAEISGTVSFHAPGSQDWQAASLNYPIAAGSGVWVEPRSHAAIDLGGARVHLDGASDLEITTLDPQGITVSVPQGAVFVHVYPGVAGRAFEIDTPQGAARINQPGQYEIVSGDDQHPMTVSVLEGAAQMVSQTANAPLRAGQRGTIAAGTQAGVSVDAVQPDDFVRMVQTAEQPYAAAVAQVPKYVSPQEPGYQDMARYGQWQQTPQYGAVWVPQVAPDWAPYRYGHWASVAPWGWTWIDDAPWGFTPFHYGRWVQIGSRWSWAPGQVVQRPVYAPALVSFFGNLGGVGISLGVGWLPLGPEEVYDPPYRHSPRYVHDINITNVRNETKIVNITNKTTIINYNNYTNRRGATMVSRDVMANSRPVGKAFSAAPKGQYDQQWAHAKPSNGEPIAPRYTANNAAHGPKAPGPKNRPALTAGSQKTKPFAAGQAVQGQAVQGQAVQGQAVQGQNKQGQGSAHPSFTQSGQPQAQFQGQNPQRQKPASKVQKPRSNAPGPVIQPQNANAKNFNQAGVQNISPKAQTAKPRIFKPQTAKPLQNGTPPAVVLANPASVAKPAVSGNAKNQNRVAPVFKPANQPRVIGPKPTVQQKPIYVPKNTQQTVKPKQNLQSHTLTNKPRLQPVVKNQPANAKVQNHTQQGGANSGKPSIRNPANGQQPKPNANPSKSQCVQQSGKACTQ